MKDGKPRDARASGVGLRSSSQLRRSSDGLAHQRRSGWTTDFVALQITEPSCSNGLRSSYSSKRHRRSCLSSSRRAVCSSTMQLSAPAPKISFGSESTHRPPSRGRLALQRTPAEQLGRRSLARSLSHSLTPASPLLYTRRARLSWKKDSLHRSNTKPYNLQLRVTPLPPPSPRFRTPRARNQAPHACPTNLCVANNPKYLTSGSGCDMSCMMRGFALRDSRALRAGRWGERGAGFSAERSGKEVKECWEQEAGGLSGKRGWAREERGEAKRAGLTSCPRRST